MTTQPKSSELSQPTDSTPLGIAGAFETATQVQFKKNPCVKPSENFVLVDQFEVGNTVNSVTEDWSHNLINGFSMIPPNAWDLYTFGTGYNDVDIRFEFVALPGISGRFLLSLEPVHPPQFDGTKSSTLRGDRYGFLEFDMNDENRLFEFSVPIMNFGIPTTSVSVEHASVYIPSTKIVLAQVNEINMGNIHPPTFEVNVYASITPQCVSRSMATFNRHPYIK